MLFVRRILACSESGASRAIGSETIDTNILRSDANLSLQDLASSRVELDLIIEAIARLMITVGIGGSESLKVRVFVSRQRQGKEWSAFLGCP